MLIHSGCGAAHFIFLLHLTPPTGTERKKLADASSFQFCFVRASAIAWLIALPLLG